MSEEKTVKDGWFIFVHKANGTPEKEVAHFMGLSDPRAIITKAVCGRELPFDISGMEPWLATNPQHIAEIRQCTKCQAAIARRDGRKPMVLDASEP
jgi:hypothetical protein